MVLLWKQYCLGVSPGVVGFREGLAEQQVELGGVLQAGLPLVEAVSHDTIWKLFTVFGILLRTYTVLYSPREAERPWEGHNRSIIQ